MTASARLGMAEGFLWGVATAAHQNEGNNPGNQWSAWEQQPGRIYASQRSGRATNWWDLETAAADFDRAAELGLNSLRLSVEWSRIEPEAGSFDRAALAFCQELDAWPSDERVDPLAGQIILVGKAFHLGRGFQ